MLTALSFFEEVISPIQLIMTGKLVPRWVNHGADVVAVIAIKLHNLSIYML